MMSLKELKNTVQNHFYSEYTETALRWFIILWSIGIIVLVLFVVRNKWILAGILAYEVLP